MGRREFGEKNPNYSKVGRKRRDPKIKRNSERGGRKWGFGPQKKSGKKLILH